MADLSFPETGDAWLNSTTNSLKYNLNGTNYTIIPQDWFVAGAVIETAGFVVSLNTSGKVVKTDSATTDKTVGLALNSAPLGNEPVEIIRAGRYHFTEEDWPTAPFLVGEIGLIAYVIDSPNGQLTTNRNAAILGSNNLIELGQVVGVRDIIIAIEGDGRGPLDYSEIEYVTGELITSTGTPKLVCQKADGLVYLSTKSTLSDRYNVVGFIVGANSAVQPLPVSTRVLVRKLGKVSGFSGLTMGLPVYAGGTDIAGTFGTLTQNVSSISTYYDKYINIGLAKSTTEIVTTIQPAYSKTDDSPIGVIILADSTKTEPDSSFLWMNGQVLNAVTNTQYQPLYAVVGNKWGGTNNTNFVLGNLNAGSLKYQIKYNSFYQMQPLYTPTYQIEYPSSTTWETYANTNKVINITSFNLASQDEFKDIQCKVYAKKLTTTVELPPLFSWNSGVEQIYGYNLMYVSNTSVQLNLATNGLAYMNASDTIILIDATWTIKIVLTKNERYNRYRDSDSDRKLNFITNSLFPFYNEMGAVDGLQAFWDMNDVPEIPNDPAGVTYLQDAWATVDGWSAFRCTTDIVTNPGNLRLTATDFNPAISTWDASWAGKSIRVKIKIISGVATQARLYITNFPSYEKIIDYDTSGEAIGDWYIPIDAIGEMGISPGYTGSAVSDVYEIDFIYIGTGAYLADSLIDNSGNGNHGKIYGATPVAGISGKALAFSAMQSKVVMGGPILGTVGSFSCWFKRDVLSVDHIIMSNAISSTGYSGWTIVATSANLLKIWNGGVSTLQQITVATVNDTNWHFIAFTSDGINIKYQYDNASIATVALTGTLSPSTLPLTIGKNVTTGGLPLHTIDEPRIYNRALTESEVLFIYEAGAGLSH